MEQIISEHDRLVLRRAAEARVRNRVMIDSIGGVDAVLEDNVGARLAAQHCWLMASVSPLALGAAWGMPA